MGKLVRDRIPDLIRQAGKTCTTRVLSPDEYATALRAKLLEEAQEVVADGADLTAELADLYEVAAAIAYHHGLNGETIRQVQAQRRTQRGGFRDRLWLDTVDDRPIP